MIDAVTEVRAIAAPLGVVCEDFFGARGIEVGEHLERLLPVAKVVRQVVGNVHGVTSGRSARDRSCGSTTPENRV